MTPRLRVLDLSELVQVDCQADIFAMLRGCNNLEDLTLRCAHWFMLIFRSEIFFLMLLSSAAPTRLPPPFWRTCRGARASPASRPSLCPRLDSLSFPLT